MNKERPTKLFWILAFAQLSLVLIPLIAYFYITASNDIAHPDHADAYFVYTWSFQITTFSIFFFLPAVLCTAVLIWIEWLVVRSVLRKRSPLS